MIRLFPLLCALCVLCGCSTSRTSRYDEFEKIKVDTMTGNDVAGKVFAKTIVCLNPMRETRWPGPITNQVVTYATNYNATSVTNVTVTSSSNHQFAAATNALAVPKGATGEPGANVAGETNQAVSVAALPGNAAANGTTLSTTSNQSVSQGANQTVTSGTAQTVTLLSNQITVSTNNQSVTSGTNQTLSVETNYVITTVTNQMVTPITNVTIVSAGGPAFDYYVATEITPPPDFSLQSGESLVLLIDGARYAFAPATPRSAWASRRGFTTTFYKVPPEVLVAIANAQEAGVRIKGTSGVIERKMSKSSRKRFQDFLLKYFSPETAEAEELRPPRG